MWTKDLDASIVAFETAKESTPVKPCEGYQLLVPEGQSPYTSYPFGMHGQHQVQWNCAIRGEKMFLISRGCSKRTRSDGAPCKSCSALAVNPVVRGICDRMNNGVQKGTTYAYLGWTDLVNSLNQKNEQNKYLRLKALNQTRTVLRQQESLSNYKCLTIAIASEDVPRVARVIHVALKKKRGVVAILEQVMAAARGVYSVKSFQEKDRLLGTLLWRLGGDRIGHIAHRVFGLPSVSTLRDASVRTPIEPSIGAPTIALIAKNVLAVLNRILAILKERRDEIQHVVIMVDELATEKRPRYNQRRNEIVGLCRAHGHKVSQVFGNLNDLEEIMKAVEDEEVHLASEVSN